MDALRYRKVLAWIGSVAAVGLAVACGDTGGGAPTPTGTEPGTILTFEQVGPDCDSDNQITLTWTLGGGATGATISIDGPGIFNSYPGTTATEKFPGACNGDTQTYLLTTTGGSGDPATATIVVPTVTTPPPAAPTIVSFQRTGPVCDSNGEVTLTWTLGGGATGATISIDGPGVYNTYPGTSRTEKFPGACGTGNTQTFLLTTQGGTGPAATATIVVNPATATTQPPAGVTIVSFQKVGLSCDPSNGNQVTLSWVVTGATGVWISIDGPGHWNSTPYPTTYTESFPGACNGDTQTFLLTTVGGTSEKTKTIVVNP